MINSHAIENEMSLENTLSEFTLTKNLICTADSNSSGSMTYKEVNPSIEGENLHLQGCKPCTFCHKEYPMDNFKGMRQTITKLCIACRERSKIYDKGRNKEHRKEIARKNEAKPERKAVKAKWSENNYEKVAKRWMNYRQRQIEKLGLEEYLKKQAEQAKKWRDKNKEKQEIINENKKNSKTQNFNVYKRSAEYKNLDFEVTFDDYVKIVESNCYYCGIIQEKGFNGIDRKDQKLGYILENCVSCCKICNYMKGSLCASVFVKRIEHILTYNKKIVGRLYPDCFHNHKGCSYDAYRNRAIKKQIEFTLSENDYNNITLGCCFMCGKETDENHKNGIDRFDNNNGYEINNVNCCCGECNYMKKDYNYNAILDKFSMIYEIHKNDVMENIDDENNRVISKSNKKPKPQVIENTKIRKERQQKELKERYNNEEYKVNRALEIAKSRKDKKETI